MKIEKTQDGTNTLYSTKYDQSYHSKRDGALSESLEKHVIPALKVFKDKKELSILDICFGLGYNTLATLYYIQKHNLDIKVNIYSPELDNELIDSLVLFQYPKEFESLKTIIHSLVETNKYKDRWCRVELFRGDARGYIKQLDKKIDIVYQDPFSADVNSELWTKEYFCDIKQLLNSQALLTTYSIATPVRLSMYENGFSIYEYHPSLKRKSTLASNFDITPFVEVDSIDMEKKKRNNPNAKPLVDDLNLRSEQE